MLSDSSMNEVLQELKAAGLSVTKEIIPGPQGVIAKMWDILSSWRIC
jgi:hypothetical protein